MGVFASILILHKGGYVNDPELRSHFCCFLFVVPVLGSEGCLFKSSDLIPHLFQFWQGCIFGPKYFYKIIHFMREEFIMSQNEQTFLCV